jgi:hypothetical protein
MDSPFSPGHGRLTAPHRHQLAFEERCVHRVLKTFGLMDLVWQMRHHYKLKWNERARLAFETFHAFFPAFPILLGARSFYGMEAWCGPAELFRKFEDLVLAEAYLETYERGRQEAKGRPVGLVCSFHGYRGGMVLHNGTFDTRGTKLVHDLRGDVPPHRLVLEPFVGLLRHLAAGGWTPQADYHTNCPTQGPRVRPAVPVLPWMVRGLGTGPAALVLAWLLGVLRSPSGYQRLHVHRDADGRRWVAASRVEMAEATGLSQRQVKDGMKALRGAGLVATKTREGRGHTHVDESTLGELRRRLSAEE